MKARPSQSRIREMNLEQATMLARQAKAQGDMFTVFALCEHIIRITGRDRGIVDDILGLGPVAVSEPLPRRAP